MTKLAQNKINFSVLVFPLKGCILFGYMTSITSIKRLSGRFLRKVEG